MSKYMKETITGTKFSFQEATVPRNKASSRRLQALIGESWFSETFNKITLILIKLFSLFYYHH